MLFCGGDGGVGCQPLNHLNHVEAAAKCTNHARCNQTVPGTQPPSNIKQCLTHRPQWMTPLLPPPYAACTIPSTSPLMSMDSPPQLGLQYLPTSATPCRPNKRKQIKRRTILLLFILINATPTGKYFLKPKTPFVPQAGARIRQLPRLYAPHAPHSRALFHNGSPGCTLHMPALNAKCIPITKAKP